ncbi:cytochrome c, putative [Geobacter metallireducens RCH3]|nr:cytochrome c, putative [Geobacter metallireducens RCH3]
MRSFLIMLCFMAVMLGSVPFVGSVHAMSAFSRKYGMKCDSCHRQRIPELNDFGVAFYKNGFMLPGQNGSAKKDTAASAAVPPVTGKESDSAGEGAPKASVKGPGEGKNEEEEEEEEEEPPPPPTVVYRLPSRDGSVYFTDNPIRQESVPVLRKKQGSRPAPSRAGVIHPAKHQGRVAAKQRMLSSVSAAVSQEHFRSYEECMEQSLLKEPPPISAEETMNRLTAAEKRCSAYQSIKR